MKRKRRLLVLGVVAIAVLAAGGAFVAWDRTRPGVTWVNFDKVQEGMGFAEVVAHLGRVPDEASQNASCWFDTPIRWEDRQRGDWVTGYWFGSGGCQRSEASCCWIRFDEDERVVSKGWRAPPSFLSRLRTSLGL